MVNPSIRATTWPWESPVVVAEPNTISASYALGMSIRNLESRVALPRHNTSTPVASGSSVPV